MRYNGHETTALVHNECGHGHVILGIMSGHYFCAGCSQRVDVEADVRPYLDAGESLAVIANVLYGVRS